ncbi:MAG TPA: methyltransferase domain-containing protein [Rubrobacteraceae bacterium]|jgi:phospholipid N-methyltransferase|nr:methyltransferase domain-containing protein [Rubrobacteraceae bacterium]
MSSIKVEMREKVRFFRSFLANPRQVGAILPTSRRAVRDMLDMADFARARTVVELGAGTGVYTEEVLKRLHPDARFFAFEVDSDLIATLNERVEDRRLHVVNDSAENVGAYLDDDKVDIIVSGLPFTSLPEPVKRNIFVEMSRVLSPDGVMVAIQYSTMAQRELKRHFASVRRRVSPVNVPPAFLFRCSAALPGEVPG